MGFLFTKFGSSRIKLLSLTEILTPTLTKEKVKVALAALDGTNIACKKNITPYEKIISEGKNKLSRWRWLQVQVCVVENLNFSNLHPICLSYKTYIICNSILVC